MSRQGRRVHLRPIGVLRKQHAGAAILESTGICGGRPVALGKDPLGYQDGASIKIIASICDRYAAGCIKTVPKILLSANSEIEKTHPVKPTKFETGCVLGVGLVL